MSIKSRTIDNLGMDASVRYANDQKLYDAKWVEESKFVSQRTEVSVSKPYVPNEFEQLFSSERTSLWASFEPPPYYFSNMKPLFSYQLIPSLGGLERQEELLDEIEGVDDALSKKKKPKQDFFQDEEEERKRKALLHFFQCIQKLDKSLSLINSRRNQYQKG